ncbi:MAG: transcription elongation GreA/GreB family factor, partial [Gammaproteobacteria bacterium]
SPMARALIKHGVDEEILLRTANGDQHYVVVSVVYADS